MEKALEELTQELFGECEKGKPLTQEQKIMLAEALAERSSLPCEILECDEEGIRLSDEIEKEECQNYFIFPEFYFAIPKEELNKELEKINFLFKTATQSK